MNAQESKDQIIAGAVTLAVAFVTVLLLSLCSLTYTNLVAQKPNAPEIMVDEEEELFIEPEILKVKGEPDATSHDSPAPSIKGIPEEAPVENNRLVTPGKNPEKNITEEKLVSTKYDSPIKTREPSATNEEKQRVTSTVAKGFAPRNGSEEGQNSTANGAGGTGVGISGAATGRTFQGCPKPSVSLSHKTTVKVAIVIDAEGRVISASASGGASAEIRQACERAAMGARWSAKKGAGESRGTLTFTITPQ